MKNISEEQLARIVELNQALASLTSNLYALLDDTMNLRMEQKDEYAAHVKNVSAQLIEKAKNGKDN